MKVIATYGKDRTLKPLDEAEVIGIIDKERGSITERVNPGYMMSKEMAMGYILKLGADAIVVKNGFLCPGSYAMSQGRIKYIVVDDDKTDSLVNSLKDAKLLDELNEEIYEE